MKKLGHKTTTIQKRLGCIRSAFNYVIEMNDLESEYGHPFKKFNIPDYKLDAEDRPDFTPSQLELLRAKVKGDTDQISGLIAVMMETGMRVSEVCSLRKEDMQLNGTHPYVTLYRSPLRRLKTKSSERFIPVVGVALEYLQSATGEWMFPKYVNTSNGKPKNDNASAAANKRLKAWLGDEAPTSHSFRHTMSTRLRDALCPADIREELGGWSRSVSDGYGNPIDIKIKTKYLKKTLTWEGQGWRHHKLG
jgi:integrase